MQARLDELGAEIDPQGRSSNRRAGISDRARVWSHIPARTHRVGTVEYRRRCRGWRRVAGAAGANQGCQQTSQGQRVVSSVRPVLPGPLAAVHQLRHQHERLRARPTKPHERSVSEPCSLVSASHPTTLWHEMPTLQRPVVPRRRDGLCSGCLNNMVLIIPLHNTRRRSHGAHAGPRCRDPGSVEEYHSVGRIHMSAFSFETPN